MRRSTVAGGLGLVVALGLGLTAAVLGGCGEADDEPATRTTVSTPSSGAAIELTVAYDDGAGTKTTGTLTCRGGEERAEGALAGRATAAALCAKARSIADLLTTQPDEQRACTQIFGGPETARVTGTLDGEKVDRLFKRTNGCEINEFDRAGVLLKP